MKRKQRTIDRTFMLRPTPQREWAEGKGWFLIIAIFLGGIGGGTYLVSLWLDFKWGLFLGWLIVLLGKSPAHLLFLGRPLRFWRAFSRSQTSWLSRGIIVLVSFVVFATLQMAPSLRQLNWLPWSSDNPLLVSLAALSAFGLIIYTGFLLGSLRAISFWNDAFLPIIFAVYSLLGGMGLLLAIHSAFSEGALYVARLERVVPWFIAVLAVVLAVYLYIMYNKRPGAKASVLELIKGRSAPLFFMGVVVLGILIPSAVAIGAITGEVSWPVLTFGAACELVGGFSFRYALLRAGNYEALI